MALTLSRRLLSAARHAYNIRSDGPVAPYPSDGRPPHSDCVGYVRSPIGCQNGPLQKDAALVGTIPEGIVVAVRGTIPYDRDKGLTAQWLADWANDGLVQLLPKALQPLPPKFPGAVHAGFYISFCIVWAELEALVDAAVHANPDLKRIYVTGHSKGGAMAALVAWRLRHKHTRHHIIVRTFAAPRVGNDAFAAAYRVAVPNHVRFEFGHDLVPHLPLQTALLATMGVDPDWGDLVQMVDSGYGDIGALFYVDVDGAFPAGDDAMTGARMAALSLLIASGDREAIATAHGIEAADGYALASYPVLQSDEPAGWASAPTA